MALPESGRDVEANDLLESLRAISGGSSGDSTFAMIEAYIALHAGDRTGAARWFASAQQTLVGQPDVRDLVEALVGLAATTTDPDQSERARTELATVCRASAVTLLPRDQALLDRGIDHDKAVDHDKARVGDMVIDSGLLSPNGGVGGPPSGDANPDPPRTR